MPGGNAPPEWPAMDDNAVETVIYKQQEASKGLPEAQLIRPSFFCPGNKIIGERTDGVRIQNIFG